MSTIIELYTNVYKKIKEIKDRIDSYDADINKLSVRYAGDTEIRIAKLEEQLEKIDEYLLRIKGYEELAKKNITSQNILTLETPPGYRVNMNRLRNWAMMIDPRSEDDPYAQRVFLVAKCDEHFLEGKKKEFTERIQQLKDNIANGEFASEKEAARLNDLKQAAQDELDNYIHSEEFLSFASSVVSANRQYCYDITPKSFSNPVEASENIALGAYAAPLPLNTEQSAWAKSLLSDFYPGSRYVMLPYEISNLQEFVINIVCSHNRRNELDSALQNLILSIIDNNPANSRKIYVIDGYRFNTSAIRNIKALEASNVLERVPKNPDQLTSTLEQLVSSLADTEEVIKDYDSVDEYNKNAEANKKIVKPVVFLLGWPDAFSGKDKDLIKRIMTGYTRYGISLVNVSYRSVKSDDGSNNAFRDMPGFAEENSISIIMQKKETSISVMDGTPQRFSLYGLKNELDQGYRQSLDKYAVKNDEKGNVYAVRCPIAELPKYSREYKKIVLPFGINPKDEISSLSFEDDMYATYLVGASRSGKSTLLHTLIAGLIYNYHPDNVELWLADFKQLEFKKYIEHRPPHVKYVLLDESAELVFDLIDKLTDLLLERQRIFARLGKERINQIDPVSLDKPLPLIFVILDEFSIMSQAIAPEDQYRLKLQNLLAKGAAMGIRFLFSSQTFTTGVVGLTPTAKAQIQQRISMKGSKEEISETLELSSNLKTEQVVNWMEALPPYYALVKFRTGPDTLPEVKRYLVLYFPDYQVRDDMIENINSKMHPIDHYDVNDIDAYVDKHPVFVDGNSFDSFPDDIIREQALTSVNENTSVVFGTPRLMEHVRMITVSNETRENLLLLCRASEQYCGASILTSAIRSYIFQGKKVQIWAYDKNTLYKYCKNNVWNTDNYSDIEYSEGMDQICDSIRMIRDLIKQKQTDDQLIVLMGIDRICSDFEFVDGSGYSGSDAAAIIDEMVKKDQQELLKKGAIATSDEEQKKAQAAIQWATIKRKLKDKLKAEGKTETEIKEELSVAYKDHMAKALSNEPAATAADAPASAQNTETEQDAAAQKGEYNAAEDFQYIIKQGSRFGYHFMVILNDYADIKTALLKEEWFRHRMSFQISGDDSRELFGNRHASTLPVHICQYSDSLNSFSFRPYLHFGLEWDGWTADENGNVINPYK